MTSHAYAVVVRAAEFKCPACAKAYTDRISAERCLSKHVDGFNAKCPAYAVGQTIMAPMRNDHSSCEVPHVIVKIEREFVDKRLLMENVAGPESAFHDRAGERTWFPAVVCYQTWDYYHDAAPYRFREVTG